MMMMVMVMMMIMMMIDDDDHDDDDVSIEVYREWQETPAERQGQLGRQRERLAQAWQHPLTLRGLTLLCLPSTTAGSTASQSSCGPCYFCYRFNYSYYALNCYRNDIVWGWLF